jgi:hypothetical protein
MHKTPDLTICSRMGFRIALWLKHNLVRYTCSKHGVNCIDFEPPWSGEIGGIPSQIESQWLACCLLDLLRSIPGLSAISCDTREDWPMTSTYREPPEKVTLCFDRRSSSSWWGVIRCLPRFVFTAEVDEPLSCCAFRLFATVAIISDAEYGEQTLPLWKGVHFYSQTVTMTKFNCATTTLFFHP